MTEDSQTRALITAKYDCLKRSNSSYPTYSLDLNEDASPFNTSQGWYCPAVWDGILCWNATPSESLAMQSCPEYIGGFTNKPDVFATRRCMKNGYWYFNHTLNTTWTNYTDCFTTIPPKIVNTLYEQYIPVIKLISTIGYSASLITLTIAFIIMFSIRKLHCSRNKLHMHLFVSFIMRAFITLLKDYIIYQGIGLRSDLKIDNETASMDLQYGDENHWGCKVMVSFWQYFITANYSWILMEGLYLHNLIFLALFSDSNNSILHYILLGWGLPACVIIPWVVLRLLYEDTLCWTTHESSVFLMIRIPTMLSILINLVLFINIARVLLIKLQSPVVSEETKRFQRWARSTLVLVPLFGVHYAIFLGMSYAINVNVYVETIWLFCDQLFASFQGCFVAILYCFLNGEVRAELKPYFQQCYNVDNLRPGRTSVCTTMSCSSLYNNGVNNRYRNGKWEGQRIKSIVKNEKCREMNHVCRAGGRSWQDMTNNSRWSSRSHSRCSPGGCSSCTQQYSFCSNSNGSMQLPEATACLDHRKERCQSEPHLDMELISMVPR